MMGPEERDLLINLNKKVELLNKQIKYLVLTSPNRSQKKEFIMTCNKKIVTTSYIMDKYKVSKPTAINWLRGLVGFNDQYKLKDRINQRDEFCAVKV
jgi:hypothetical protein